MPSIHKFLAIETSTSPGSVAVGTLPSHDAGKPESDRFGNFLLQETQLPEEGGQGRHLMPTLVALVESAGWPLNEVALVVVATGPGPFTGLRVGVTTAKALAWTNDCHLVGVSTTSCLQLRPLQNAVRAIEWRSFSMLAAVISMPQQRHDQRTASFGRLARVR